MNSSDWIMLYFSIYTLVVLFIICYKYAVKVIRKEIRYPEYKTTFSVIIPTHNEEPKLLERCIRSVVKADGDKEIFVIDDGSSKELKQPIFSLQKKYGFTFINLKRNVGKREAQLHGFRKARNETIITIDSDTIIRKDALIEIAKPFNNPRIGAVTGNAKVLNKNVNLLTRIIDARYTNAFEFERDSQSTFGIVSCCTGVLSAYRKSIINEVSSMYVNQTFLGKKCTYGDDRHLTALVLKDWDVVMAKRAIAYTAAPTKLGNLVRQQIRWKCSFIRENFLAFSYIFKRSKLLSMEMLIDTFLPPFSLLVRLSVVYFVIFYPITILYYIFMIALMALVRNLEPLYEKKWKLVWHNAIYGYLQMGVIYWLYYAALWKVFVQRDTGWQTR